ncbi:hypothetical protein [Actinomadura sp. WMMB 499]|uniref:hypothetical protein n=1 Tax=Actinomadura sp. WMMB 499 TaxID=1219491 RepID=UPI00159E69D8|nr:hypothetical protein [Actinomadura sp. WMMB 499]
MLVAGVVSAAVFLTQGDGKGGPGGSGSAAASSPGSGSTGSGSTGVPAGYEPYEGSSFAVAVPKGWKAEASGDDVTFSDPAEGSRRGIAIQRIASSHADLGGSLADAAEGFARDDSYQDYDQVRFDRSLSYQGHDAAELEFTFTQDGVAGRCRVRVFRFDDAVYQAVLVGRADTWREVVPHYETFLKTLRAAG